MKKSLYAAWIILLSVIGAKSYAAQLESNQITKGNITTSSDGTGPGGNGSVKNGTTFSK